MRGEKLAETSPEHIDYPSEKPTSAAIDEGATGQGVSRTARRARRKQKSAATESDETDQPPTLGALNRHLNVVVQQLTAAHQVIGRVVAERDALRQQLADLLGVPVEEIELPTIGATNDTPPRQ